MKLGTVWYQPPVTGCSVWRSFFWWLVWSERSPFHYRQQTSLMDSTPGAAVPSADTRTNLTELRYLVQSLAASQSRHVSRFRAKQMLILLQDVCSICIIKDRRFYVHGFSPLVLLCESSESHINTGFLTSNFTEDQMRMKLAHSCVPVRARSTALRKRRSHSIRRWISESNLIKNNEDYRSFLIAGWEFEYLTGWLFAVA